MNRNVNDYFSKTPTPHFPRNKFDFGVHKRLQTQGHGRLYPFYCRMVYPGDTWQMDMSVFVRADTSVRVPLDDIYLDTYFFFVPFRILGDDFAAALGDVDAYDDSEHNLPIVNIDANELSFGINGLLPYLGYSQAIVNFDEVRNSYNYENYDEISVYPLAAYYEIYNSWFRDENVDNLIPYQDLYNESLFDLVSSNPSLFDLYDGFNCLRVNKYHDYFTSGVINPTKGNGGAAVTIPLGTTAPVGFTSTDSGNLVTNSLAAVIPVGSVVSAGFNQLETFSGTVSNPGQGNSIFADLSNAAGTINELYLAMALNSLYNRRARFGTRYIETIRGQWGIEVPDSFFERPEYLGGSRTTLNMVPVLSTENSSQLGQMAGNSSTLSGGVNFSKTFVEYGLIFGLSCTRIKHSYTQGFRKEIFGLKTSLDLYNPVFANIGFEPVLTKEIYNLGSDDNRVFNYQEAWAYLRTDIDSFAGLFGNVSQNNDLKNLWHYGDYYASFPTFSSSWLKEDYKNVARTMTGQLIEGASSIVNEGHQYMFAYYFHPVVTRILPSHSIPPELTGRI